MARPTGSAGVLEQGKGMGRATWEPERSRVCPCVDSRIGSAGRTTLQARPLTWRRPGALRRARMSKTTRKPEAKP